MLPFYVIRNNAQEKPSKLTDNEAKDYTKAVIEASARDLVANYLSRGGVPHSLLSPKKLEDMTNAEVASLVNRASFYLKEELTLYSPKDDNLRRGLRLLPSINLPEVIDKYAKEYILSVKEEKDEKKEFEVVPYKFSAEQASIPTAFAYSVAFNLDKSIKTKFVKSIPEENTFAIASYMHTNHGILIPGFLSEQQVRDICPQCADAMISKSIPFMSADILEKSMMKQAKADLSKAPDRWVRYLEDNEPELIWDLQKSNPDIDCLETYKGIDFVYKKLFRLPENVEWTHDLYKGQVEAISAVFDLSEHYGRDVLEKAIKNLGRLTQRKIQVTDPHTGRQFMRIYYVDPEKGMRLHDLDRQSHEHHSSDLTGRFEEDLNSLNHGLHVVNGVPVLKHVSGGKDMYAISSLKGKGFESATDVKSAAQVIYKISKSPRLVAAHHKAFMSSHPTMGEDHKADIEEAEKQLATMELKQGKPTIEQQRQRADLKSVIYGHDYIRPTKKTKEQPPGVPRKPGRPKKEPTIPDQHKAVLEHLKAKGGQATFVNKEENKEDQHGYAHHKTLGRMVKDGLIEVAGRTAHSSGKGSVYDIKLADPSKIKEVVKDKPEISAPATGREPATGVSITEAEKPEEPTYAAEDTIEEPVKEDESKRHGAEKTEATMTEDEKRQLEEARAKREKKSEVEVKPATKSMKYSSAEQKILDSISNIDPGESLWTDDYVISKSEDKYTVRDRKTSDTLIFDSAEDAMRHISEKHKDKLASTLKSEVSRAEYAKRIESEKEQRREDKKLDLLSKAGKSDATQEEKDQFFKDLHEDNARAVRDIHTAVEDIITGKQSEEYTGEVGNEAYTLKHLGKSVKKINGILDNVIDDKQKEALEELKGAIRQYTRVEPTSPVGGRGETHVPSWDRKRARERELLFQSHGLERIKQAIRENTKERGITPKPGTKVSVIKADKPDIEERILESGKKIRAAIEKRNADRIVKLQDESVSLEDRLEHSIGGSDYKVLTPEQKKIVDDFKAKLKESRLSTSLGAFEKQYGHLSDDELRDKIRAWQRTITGIEAGATRNFPARSTAEEDHNIRMAGQLLSKRGEVKEPEIETKETKPEAKSVEEAIKEPAKGKLPGLISEFNQLHDKYRGKKGPRAKSDRARHDELIGELKQHGINIPNDTSIGKHPGLSEGEKISEPETKVLEPEIAEAPKAKPKVLVEKEKSGNDIIHKVTIDGEKSNVFIIQRKGSSGYFLEPKLEDRSYKSYKTALNRVVSEHIANKKRVESSISDENMREEQGKSSKPGDLVTSESFIRGMLGGAQIEVKGVGTYRKEKIGSIMQWVNISDSDDVKSTGEMYRDYLLGGKGMNVAEQKSKPMVPGGKTTATAYTPSVEPEEEPESKEPEEEKEPIGEEEISEEEKNRRLKVGLGVDAASYIWHLGKDSVDKLPEVIAKAEDTLKQHRDIGEDHSKLREAISYARKRAGIPAREVKPEPKPVAKKEPEAKSGPKKAVIQLEDISGTPSVEPEPKLEEKKPEPKPTWEIKEEGGEHHINHGPTGLHIASFPTREHAENALETFTSEDSKRNTVGSDLTPEDVKNNRAKVKETLMSHGKRLRELSKAAKAVESLVPSKKPAPYVKEKEPEAVSVKHHEKGSKELPVSKKEGSWAVVEHEGKHHIVHTPNELHMATYDDKESAHSALGKFVKDNPHHRVFGEEPVSNDEEHSRELETLGSIADKLEGYKRK